MTTKPSKATSEKSEDFQSLARKVRIYLAVRERWLVAISYGGPRARLLTKGHARWLHELRKAIHD